MFNRLFPSRVDHHFDGLRSALWLFGLLIALKLVIGLNSIFNTRSVASGADGIPVERFSAEAAQEVLMLFALNALGQIILALIALMVLVRWRSLVPFLFLVFLIDQSARRLVIADHDLVRINGSPAAGYIAYGMLAVIAAGLILSLIKGSRNRRATRSTA